MTVLKIEEDLPFCTLLNWGESLSEIACATTKINKQELNTTRSLGDYFVPPDLNNKQGIVTPICQARSLLLQTWQIN